MRKVCTRCGVEKDLSDFNRMTGTHDGRRPDCRICHRAMQANLKERYPVEFRARTMAHELFRRLKHTDRPRNRSYIGIECRLGDTPKEVTQVILKHFYTDIEKLIDAGVTPSLDRKDPSDHYELGNIRIIDSNENAEMGRRKGTEVTSRSVCAWEDDGMMTFPSVSAAARHYGIKRDTVIASCNTGKPTRKGILFQYE